MKTIFAFLFVLLLGQASFSESIPRVTCIKGFFPTKQLSVLEKITQDALIFSRTDTFLQSKFEWGFLYPHRFSVKFTRKIYHKVTIEENNLMIVLPNEHESAPQQVGSYSPNPLLFKWGSSAVLFSIHFYIFFALRKRLCFIFGDDKRISYKKQKMRARLLIIFTALIAILVGYFVKSYFFIFLPIIYFILIFVPTKTWRSRLAKMELYG